MSLTTRNPVRFIGGNLNSGYANTGEVAFTRGGQLTFSAYSGGMGLQIGSGGIPPPTGAAHVLADHGRLFSGAGRLHTVIPHQALSGVAITFYDGAAPAVSGVGLWRVSGLSVLGTVPANSFLAFGTLGGPMPIALDVPFFSGLCVNASSGTPGFTCTFTPEVSGFGIPQA